MEEVTGVSSSLRCSICSTKGVKSAIVITDPESGEVICSNCGMVISQNIEDTRPEWRSFGSQGEGVEGYGKSRTGMPTSLARHDKGLTTIIGRTEIDAILAAASYIACRDLNVPKTLKEVAAASGIKLKILSKSYRVLVFKLNISTPPVIDPMKCIVKVANKADLNENTKRQAMDVMNNLTKREISAGKHPMAVAATVLYVSCLNSGENKTQTDIADAAGITEVTLRNRY